MPNSWSVNILADDALLTRPLSARLSTLFIMLKNSVSSVIEQTAKPLIFRVYKDGGSNPGDFRGKMSR
jgi:hypothetical protein